VLLAAQYACLTQIPVDIGLRQVGAHRASTREIFFTDIEKIRHPFVVYFQSPNENP
jgi:hypothetical protein